jgi:hypothetical protein
LYQNLNWEDKKFKNGLIHCISNKVLSQIFIINKDLLIIILIVKLKIIINMWKYQEIKN